VLQFWNRRKKRIAESIVKASPKLMVRPMLLAYIDYLVEDERQFKTTYQIYESLIEKWIEREANKRKHESTSREKFKSDLNAFSRKIALVVYDKHRQHSTLSVDKETARQLCEAENLELRDYEITGQSLLTRDANHHWKFAHKSILEFFLSKEAAENMAFWMQLLQSNFAGMDMAKTFCAEVGISDLVHIKGGLFKMDDQHPVKVHDYYLMKYPVTQAEYQALAGNNPSKIKTDERCPVEMVNWFEAAAYCNLLNRKAGLPPAYDDKGNLLDPSGQITTNITRVKGFRLPTEAEWEYAAGGGLENRTKWAGTNIESELVRFAWYEKNSGSRTHPVGELQPNALGLYDMSGNVWEWCTDWYADYYFKNHKDGSTMENPVNCNAGSHRVLRGGSWYDYADGCRVSSRGRNQPVGHLDDLGFRVVLVP
jgi:sulfatase modifying factor 1